MESIFDVEEALIFMIKEHICIKSKNAVKRRSLDPAVWHTLQKA
jgi:hypothetical protein